MSELKKREYIPKDDLWAIEDMFASDEKWEEAFSEVEKLLPRLSEYKGKVDIDNLYELFTLRDEIFQKLEYISVYAGLRANEDSTNTLHQAMDERSELLLTRAGEISSFIDPELLALDRDELLALIKTEPMSLYSHVIEDVLRSGEHILSADKEELLAGFSDVSGAPSNIYYMLNNADMRFPDVTDSKGTKHVLTHGRFNSLLESGDRVLRENAFKAVYQTYFAHRNTLGAVYSSQIKADVFTARARNFDSSLEASLFANNIPTSVYTGLIETVGKRLDLMHRYVALRKKILNVDKLHYYDMYTPLLSGMDNKIRYEAAVRLVKKAVEPLGEEYLEKFSSALEKERWVDKYENVGKRSGAYSWGAYGSHPYVSMSYEENIDSVFTLIHEMGHSMHSYYTWSSQPYVYGDYTIFVAEVASTVNEALLMRHLLSSTKDTRERLFLLNHFADEFRGTLYRQTMFAEFELKVHTAFENGNVLTFDDYNRIYSELNKKYYGDDIFPDEEISWEWTRIPHFYTPFYVYQYATGYSAAIALSKRITEENGAEDYIDFLKGGSSKYSIDLLKGAGVDMSSPLPVNTALDVFEDVLNQMEELWAQTMG